MPPIAPWSWLPPGFAAAVAAVSEPLLLAGELAPDGGGAELPHVTKNSLALLSLENLLSFDAAETASKSAESSGSESAPGIV